VRLGQRCRSAASPLGGIGLAQSLRIVWATASSSLFIARSLRCLAPRCNAPRRRAQADKRALVPIIPDAVEAEPDDVVKKNRRHGCNHNCARPSHCADQEAECVRRPGSYRALVETLKGFRHPMASICHLTASRRIFSEVRQLTFPNRLDSWVHPLLKSPKLPDLHASIHSYTSHRIANLQVFCLGRRSIEPRLS
jgi:hypothetical protein